MRDTAPMDEPHTCPHCGHMLSMFTEPAPDRGERVAARIVSFVASWWFPIGLIVAISVWGTINLFYRGLEPYPMLPLAILATTLGSIAALQGPLILITQRRSAQRDRARDRETYLVASRNEQELHELLTEMTRLRSTLEKMKKDS